MTSDELLDELAQVAAGLGSGLEPPGAERLLTSLAETARRLLGARACSLALLSEEGSELVYTTASGDGADAVTGLRMPAAAGIAGWVVQSGQPVAVSDVRADPRFSSDVAETTGYVPATIVAAPVVSDRGMLGVLSVLDRDASRPGASNDLLLLQVFCDQAAIALETARSFREMSTVVLTALATAAAQRSSLSDQLRVAAASAPDDDALQIAALLGRVTRADGDVRDLVLSVLGDVLSYVERGGTSRPGG